MFWDKSDGQLEFADNARAIFGNGSDLTAYHDGSNSKITHTGAGGLYIGADTFGLQNGTHDENYIVMSDNGSVDLYYDNVKVFNTDGNGIMVKGPEGGSANVYIYADEGDDNNDKFQLTVNDGGPFHIQNRASGSVENNIKCYGGGAVELYHNNVKTFETTSDGIKITSTGYIDFPDNGRIRMGTGFDLAIYHDGSDSWIRDAGTGRLLIDGSEIHIRKYGTSETMAKFIQDGAVELYHDNSKKFETNSAGVKVTGGLEATGFLAVADNQNIYAGSDNDFYIRHNGTNAMLGNGTGDLYIWNTAGNDSSVIRIQAKYDEDSIRCTANGSVRVAYDNSTKLETTSTGINVTGVINVNGSPLSAAPTFTATASGAITADKPLILNTDATVSQVAETAVSASTGSTVNVPSSGAAKILCSVWVSATKFVQFWEEPSNSNGLYAAVGVVTNNTTITYGSRTAIGLSGGSALTSVTIASCAYDTSKEVVIVAAVNPNGSNAGIHWFGCTVTGTNTLNVNSTTLSSTDGNFYGCAIAVDNKGHACTSTIFSNNNWIQYGVTIGTGGAISAKTNNQSGSSGQYGYAYGPRMDVCYNPDKDRFVASAYRQSGSDYHCSVLRLSNGDISSSGGGNAGSPVSMQSSINSGFATIDYDSVNKQYIGTFRKSSQFRYKTFVHDAGNIESLDGGSGTAGTLLAVEPDDYGYGTFMAKTGKAYFIFRTASNVRLTTTTFSGGAGGSASGSTVQIESPTSYDFSISANESGRLAIGFSTTNTSPAQGRTHIRQQAVTNTNLDTNNFIGFASGSYSNGNTATIKINSNTSTQSSLTPVSTYFVQSDGTLGTSADTPSVVAGIALSSTKLLIKY